MNEPKKRGRPSKADIAAREAVASREDVLDPRPMVVLQEVVSQRLPVLEAVMTNAMIDDGKRFDRAQAYAMKVWAGQSTELKRAERIARIERALEGQNLPTAGIKYPEGQDDDDWTEEDSAPITWRKARA